MAVVESLGRIIARGNGGGAGRGRRISWIAVATVLAIAPIVRAAEFDAMGWVAPASLDAVPVRAIDIAPDAVTPKPIVVPLPSGLETGGAFLAALGAARWWGSRRRRA
jgi:hypothetical protein